MFHALVSMFTFYKFVIHHGKEEWARTSLLQQQRMCSISHACDGWRELGEIHHISIPAIGRCLQGSSAAAERSR